MFTGTLTQTSLFVGTMAAAAVMGYHLGWNRGIREEKGEDEINVALGIPRVCEFPKKIGDSKTCGGLNKVELLGIRFENGGENGGNMVLKWPAEAKFSILIKKIEGAKNKDYPFVFVFSSEVKEGEKKYEQNLRKVNDRGESFDLIVLNDGARPEYRVKKNNGTLWLEEIKED